MNTVRKIIKENNKFFQQLSSIQSSQSNDVSLEQLLADLDILLDDISRLEEMSIEKSNTSSANAYAWCGKYLKKITDNFRSS